MAARENRPMKKRLVYANFSYFDLRVGTLCCRFYSLRARQIDYALELQQRCGLRLGNCLLELGYITARQLYWALYQQHCQRKQISGGSMYFAASKVSRKMNACKAQLQPRH